MYHAEPGSGSAAALERLAGGRDEPQRTRARRRDRAHGGYYAEGRMIDPLVPAGYEGNQRIRGYADEDERRSKG